MEGGSIHRHSEVLRIDSRPEGEGGVMRPKFKKLRKKNFIKKGKLNPRF